MAGDVESETVDYLAYASTWLRDYAGPPELVLGLDHGSDRSECAVGWLTADGPAAFGHLTLWESGEVAIEVYDAVTADLLLRSRGRVSSLAELAPHLWSFVVSAARRTEAGSVAGGRDTTGGSAGGSPLIPRRRTHR